MQTSTDNEIISEVLAGHQEHFAILIKRYQQGAYRLSLSILRNPTDAEDAVSEAFSKAYAALAHCRDDTNFKSWFLKITYNCCQDILRRRKRESLGPGPADIAENNLHQNPLQNLVIAEDKKEIWQALNHLNPEDRTAMVMKYYQNASYQDIAAILHWPQGTVASRLYRAREKMRQYMVGGEVG